MVLQWINRSESNLWTPRDENMFGCFSLGSIRGVGMVVLQTLRVFTVITLAAVCASCWVLIIKVGKDQSYFVFECVSLFFTFVISAVLIISEFPLLEVIKDYLRDTWPVLSESHGVAWPGVAMIMISCNMLGNLNRPAYDADNLGPHFSKLVLASSVLAFTFGGLNIICSLVWRDGKERINARNIRADGSLADRRETLPGYDTSTRSNPSIRDEKTRSKFVSMFWKKNTGEMTFDRPIISGPISSHQDVEHDAGASDRRSPIVPGLKRPDTALHPMNTGRTSKYSEAHMSRF